MAEFDIKYDQAKQKIDALALQGKQYVEEMNKCTKLVNDLYGSWHGQTYYDLCQAWSTVLSQIEQVNKELVQTIPKQLIAALNSHLKGDNRTKEYTVPTLGNLPLGKVTVPNVDDEFYLDTDKLKSFTNELDSNIGVAGTIIQNMPDTMKEINSAMHSTASEKYVNTITNYQEDVRKKLADFRTAFRENLDNALATHTNRDQNMESIGEGLYFEDFVSESDDLMKTSLENIQKGEEWKSFFGE